MNSKELDLNNENVRLTLFGLIPMLNKDIDGDVIEIEGTMYYVNLKSNIISIAK